jgi:hypothetical protein
LTIPSRSIRLALLLGILLAAPAAPLAAAAQDPPKPAGDDPKPAGDDPKPEEKKPDEKKPEEKKPEEPAAPDPEAEAKKIEEIKAYLKQYEDQLSKMTDQDAIDGLGKMKAWYVDPKIPEDSKKDILRTFAAKVVKARGREAYLEAAAKTLGEMGGEEVIPYLKYLVDYGLNVKGSIAGVVRAGLASFGKVAPKKPADVKWLTDMLRGKDEFISDVCNAMAGYQKGPGAIRRDMVEDLIKISEGVHSKAEDNDNTAKRRWNTWGSECIDAMQKLSGKTDLKTPAEFRKWLQNKDPGGGKHPKTWADADGH